MPSNENHREPISSGLFVETWSAGATTVFEKAWLPIRIAFRPFQAYRHAGRPEDSLVRSSRTTAMWTLAWLIIVFVLGVFIRYGHDRIAGFQLAIGDYWHYPTSCRFAHLGFFPVDCLLSYVSCVLVAFLGQVIVKKSLDSAEALRLAGWLFPLSIVAACAHAFYPVLSRYSNEILFWLIGPKYFDLAVPRIGSSLAEFVFGMLAGVAVGTVLQHKRWFIGLFSAVVLIIANPLTNSAYIAYRNHVLDPFRDVFFRPAEYLLPAELALQRPSDLQEITFEPGGCSPELAGRWQLIYEPLQEHPGLLELDIDNEGCLEMITVTVSPERRLVLQADGIRHEVDLKEVAAVNDELESVDYLVASAITTDDGGVRLTLRTEVMYEFAMKTLSGMSIVTHQSSIGEERFIGSWGENDNEIVGTSEIRREIDGYQPMRREFKATLRRLTEE